MNDIEVLEERVTTLKRHIKNYEESDCRTNVYQQLVKECNAIENLLTRNKDLEEINEAHKKENGELREIVEKQQSLIKEKIKELEFAIAFCGNEDRMKRLILQKEVLEELLKGE